MCLDYSDLKEFTGFATAALMDARAAIGVAALPKGVGVEMDAVLVID